MKKAASVWSIAVCLVAFACSSDGGDARSSTSTERLAGDSALGGVPNGLPARLAVGLFSDTGDTWMRDSGVKWDVRYRYFTKGWVNNWGFGNYDGSWGLGYMRECSQQGFIPAIQYYQMNGEPGGGEGAFLTKAQNRTTMRSYFGDFKLLMQRARDFAKPVVVLLEADGYGFLQQQTAGNAGAYAAVADTGMPELAGLPNTVAGWGLAFLQIRKAVGAGNAVLGMHISGWASGKDIAHFNVKDALQPEVTKVYDFLAPLGLGPNVTGQTYDVLVGDPLDRDADYYRLVLGQDRWWDPSDSAPIDSKSFNRYAEWLRLWNQTAKKRWILWQIPLGNSNHLNVDNSGGARQGYKDNRPEYFFGNGTAHLVKFANVGVIQLLFGAGLGGQSWYTNDVYTDGQLFMKSRAGAILDAGGVPIASGSGGSGGSGGAAGTGGSGGISGCTPINGTGTGVTGDYYDTQTLPAAGTAPTRTRTDARIDFNWSGSPDPALPADRFSVRWRGKVQPRFSGSYTFYTTSDDGVRLWVNGQRLVDNWTNHAATENSGTIALTAGTQYDLVMEYYEAAGGAVARLSWSGGNGCEAKAVVPQSQLYPASAASGDGARYDFEAGTQGFGSSGGMITGVASSTAQAFAGTRSLAVSLNGSGTQYAYVDAPAVGAGATITFHVFVPAGVALSSIQPFALQGAAGGWAWSGAFTPASQLRSGSWNTLTVTVPANATLPLARLGVEFTVSSASVGTAYIDSINW